MVEHEGFRQGQRVRRSSWPMQMSGLIPRQVPEDLPNRRQILGGERRRFLVVLFAVDAPQNIVVVCQHRPLGTVLDALQGHLPLKRGVADHPRRAQPEDSAVVQEGKTRRS
jgi:hypothetical protein